MGITVSQLFIKIMGDASRPWPTGDSQHGSPYDRDDQDPAKNLQHGGNPASLQQGNFAYMNQYPQSHGSPARQEPFNMNTLGGALPSYPDYNNHPQRFHPGSSSAGLGYQMQSGQQYAGSPVGHSGSNGLYTHAYNAQYQGQYASAPSPQIQQHNLSAMYNTGYMGQPQQQGQSFYLQQNQYMPQSPVFPIMSGGPQFGGRGNLVVDPRLHTQQRGRDFPGPASGLAASGRSSSIGECYANSATA